MQNKTQSFKHAKNNKHLPKTPKAQKIQDQSIAMDVRMGCQARRAAWHATACHADQVDTLKIWDQIPENIFHPCTH